MNFNAFTAVLFVVLTGPHSFARSVTVTIDSMKFIPASVAIEKGQTIVWVNKDLFPHTVTANDGSFDSGVINPGGKWTYKSKVKGTVAYKCILHPPMTAEIKVK
jgi:plastocyanin